jgi:hypothetical protein
MVETTEVKDCIELALVGVLPCLTGERVIGRRDFIYLARKLSRKHLFLLLLLEGGLWV